MSVDTFGRYLPHPQGGNAEGHARETSAVGRGCVKTQFSE